MTKWEFKQIVMRSDLAAKRDMKDFIGESFITPFLLLEAEKDRNDLLVFCGKLAKKIGKDNESE